MWSGDAHFVHNDNPDVGFVIPKEGTTVWADTLAIPKGAKHKELAEAFINFLYDPEVSVKTMNTLATMTRTRRPLPFIKRLHQRSHVEDGC